MAYVGILQYVCVSYYNVWAYIGVEGFLKLRHSSYQFEVGMVWAFLLRIDGLGFALGCSSSIAACW